MKIDSSSSFARSMRSNFRYLIGGMPTSDLKMWLRRQTERFTDCANSGRESSPRTSARIISRIFSTRLFNETPGESCVLSASEKSLLIKPVRLSIGLLGWKVRELILQRSNFCQRRHKFVNVYKNCFTGVAEFQVVSGDPW